MGIAQKRKRRIDYGIRTIEANELTINFKLSVNRQQTSNSERLGVGAEVSHIKDQRLRRRK